MQSEDVNRLTIFCVNNLKLSSSVLGEEYFYQSLPLCVIDAVFSIGVRYEGVRNVIKNYCNYFNIEKHTRQPRELLPAQADQKSISNFLDDVNALGGIESASKVFKNSQRTSTKNGILKADAVKYFASVLLKNGVNYFQDVNIILSSGEISRACEEQIKNIPGQSSGISISYFYMLAGSENLIKPDRMVLRFLDDVLDRHSKSVSLPEAQQLITAASLALKPEYPDLNPRLLDHVIWNFQRELNIRIKSAK